MGEEDAPSTEEPAESQTGLPAPAPPPRSGEVQSVRRALSLLDALAEHGGGASLKELAGATALAPSTAHRLLTTLESARFVRFDPVEGAWRIGVAAFTVGGAFLAGRDLSVIARPYLRRLMEITGETANLYLWTEQEPVCVAQVECRQTMRAIAKVGTRVRIHCSGAGKAIVAALPEADQRATLHGLAFTAFTPKTITSQDSLTATLAKTASQGYAVDDEEHTEGLRCVAAAVRDETGAPVGAISISGPLSRIPAPRLGTLGEQVRGVAAELQQAYGGPRG